MQYIYNDLPGLAILDYQTQKFFDTLFVQDEFGIPVEMPVDMYFRAWYEMPHLEQIALEHCHGRILDIGAGAGSHALYLQEQEKEVVALEISESACKCMVSRGVQNIICDDIFKMSIQKYDTLLLLMNGIGLCGSIERLKYFLQLAKKIIRKHGQIIFDSCDISYMYEQKSMPVDKYYGEVNCKYKYGTLHTDWFQWLYIDKNLMQKTANAEGWQMDILEEDENNQYLARLVMAE